VARLPQPGQDAGTWGEILNNFLAQAHGADGTLKPDSVGNIQIKSGAIQTSHLANGVISKASVGLTNVDDTADINKPVSSATQSVLSTKLSITDLDSQAASIIADTNSTTASALSAKIDDVLANNGSAINYAGLPSGFTLTIFYDTTSGWPSRPTNRTDISVLWVGGDENNSPPDAAVGCDLWERPVS